MSQRVRSPRDGLVEMGLSNCLLISQGRSRGQEFQNRFLVAYQLYGVAIDSDVGELAETAHVFVEQANAVFTAKCSPRPIW